MKSLALLTFLFLSACNGTGFGVSEDGTESGVGNPGISLPVVAGSNVMAVQVGRCGPNTYFNEPCVSVTICVPGTTNCQTIPNILLDTGSYGLRIFASAVTLPLPAEKDSAGRTLAECAQFGSGAEWGQVVQASVVLGGEPAVQVPMHLVDAGFATAPENCTDLDTADNSGFNGILGVGLFTQDCGEGCLQPGNQVYFACSGTDCSSAAVGLAQQIVNPVALLPVDNNGVILQLPAVPSGGVSFVTGNLILGIGTQSNNQPGTVSVFSADGNGNITTTFQGQNFSNSFIDSGSNGFFFPQPSQLAECSSFLPGFFCPPSVTSFVATQVSHAAKSPVPFSIGNAESELQSGNFALSDLGASISGNLSLDFDWGLPFFFGRQVYVGINGKTSSLGSGAYWAY